VSSRLFKNTAFTERHDTLLAYQGGSPLRGKSPDQQAIFSYVSLEDCIPKWHPLRDIRQIVDKALAELWPTFDAMYAQAGRP